MPISIKDVARKANVSVTTVSRVINDAQNVKTATREHVRKCIQELGYQPNLNARGLVSGKTNTLALITPSDPDFFGAYYFREVVRGISEVLAQHHYRFVIYQPECGETPQEIRINGSQADGVFLIAPPADDRLLRRMEDQKRPAVVISARSQDLDWVDLDNLSASTQVFEKMMEMGHRRIGFITGGCGADRNMADRLEGYRSVLGRSGIAYNESLVMEGSHKIAGGREAAKKLLALPERPTAIFGINDYAAIGAMRAVQESGLNVPGDVSIFGFDDIEISSLVTPPLSTVRQPFSEMGRIACKMLIERLQHPELPQQTSVLNGEFILRASARSV